MGSNHGATVMPGGTMLDGNLPGLAPAIWRWRGEQNHQQAVTFNNRTAGLIWLSFVLETEKTGHLLDAHRCLLLWRKSPPGFPSPPPAEACIKRHIRRSAWAFGCVFLIFGGYSWMTGRTTVKVLPSSGCDSTQMRPWWAS